jgi:hypothetical protein
MIEEMICICGNGEWQVIDIKEVLRQMVDAERQLWLWLEEGTQ